MRRHHCLWSSQACGTGWVYTPCKTRSVQYSPFCYYKYPKKCIGVTFSRGNTVTQHLSYFFSHSRWSVHLHSPSRLFRPKVWLLYQVWWVGEGRKMETCEQGTARAVHCPTWRTLQGLLLDHLQSDPKLTSNGLKIELVAIVVKLRKWLIWRRSMLQKPCNFHFLY